MLMCACPITVEALVPCDEGTKAEVKRGYHFINKSAKVLPAINYELKKSWRSFPWNLNQPEVDVPVRYFQ
eukprot:SAG31_NODE_29_length_32663_cov_14.779695_5_plen_70_part_00